MNTLIKYIGLLIGLSIVILISSCSTTSDPQPKNVPNIPNPQKVRVVWNISSLASGSRGSFIPCFDENAIYTADNAGDIYKIDRTDGTIINLFRLRRSLSSGTATSSDSIFVTTTDGYLLSIDKVTGKIVWQAQLPTLSIEAPQSTNGIVVLKTNDAEIIAYNATNGNILWVYQRNNPPLTLRATKTFQIVGKDVVLVGQPGGRMALINLSNGTVIWETYVAMPEGATDLDKLTDVAIRPAIDDKEICVATYNGKLVCLNAITSGVIWSRAFSTTYDLLINNDSVYAISIDGTIYSFDKNTGGILWQNSVLQYRSLSSPVLLGDNLLIIDSEGFINLVDKNNGALVAREKSKLQDGISLPWSDGKSAIVQSANGNIAEIE